MKTVIFTHCNKDYIIFIGENKYDNWEIIEKSSEQSVWFHVEGMPSSHIILQTQETIREIPKQVITRCACLCKAHSSAKSLKKCKIIYTQIKNVTKTDIVGQVTTTNTKKIII